MSSYTDGFASDPTTWVASGVPSAPSYTHDSGNGELDMNVADADPWGFRYPSSLASIDHEVQVTFQQDSDGVFGSRCVACMPRMRSGALDGYAVHPNTEFAILEIKRIVGGSIEEVDDGDLGYTTFSYTVTAGNFYTVRIAAEGSAGSNVTVSIWITDHGASKPSDPGWIGLDNSPDFTFVDSDATRLDEATATYAGLGGRGASEEYDPRYDFWKARDVSERSPNVEAALTGLSATAAVGTVMPPAAATNVFYRSRRR